MKKIFPVTLTAMALAMSATLLAGCSQAQEQNEVVSETVMAVYDVYDTSDGVAATVNGVEIGEKSVTAYVDSKREAFDMTDEEAWAQYLASAETTPEKLREQIIDQFVNEEIIRQAAADNGIEVTEEEIDRAYDQVKESAGNESTWRIYLKQTGQTEYDVREAQRISLLRQKLYYLVTGTNELEELVDEITSQMLASAADSEELQELQAQQEALPANASQEERDELTAKIEAAQQKAAENVQNVQEFVNLIDRGMAKMKEAMGAQVYEATDEEVLAYVQQSDESLAGLDSLDGIPATIIAYIRAQLTDEKESQAYTDFMAKYTNGATIVVNDAPEGLTYFIVVPEVTTDEAVAEAIDENATESESA